MTESEEIKKIIAQTSSVWAEDFIAARLAQLQTQKAVASGDLIKSFQLDVNQAKADAVETLIAFSDGGRFIDMRQKSIHTKDAGGTLIEKLEDWIERKGKDKFIQSFMKKRKLRKVPKNVLNQIAWGIAINRTKGKFRRKAWYNKPKEAAISDLFNQVASQLPTKVGEQMKKQLEK